MIRDVIVHNEAEEEIFQALAWYAERSAIAARAFVQELSSMVRLAVQSPQSCETIEIVAVAHQRRRPSYWKGR